MQKQFMAALAAGLLSSSMLSSAYAADKPLIVTTIPPIQGLAEALVGDLAEVQPLSNSGATPHGRTLKPSDVRKLTKADMVVQVGPVLESSIQKVLHSNVEDDHILTLEEIRGIHLLEIREGGVWGEGHNHDHDHGHGDHDDHAEEKHDDHGHEDHAEEHHDEHGHDDHAHEEHGHDDHGHEDHAHDEKEHKDHDHAEHEGHDDHDHEKHAEHEEHHDEHGHEEHFSGDGHAHDPHLWLSVKNAKMMVDAMEAQLVAHSPELKDGLAERKTALIAKLEQLDQDLSAQLAGLGDVSYLVFHDAYQYFEDSYGLKPAGAVLLDPERKPGAKRLSELREFVEHNNVKCVFTEPQFKPKLVKVLQEDTNLKTGELDPIGFGLETGGNQYFELMQNLSTSLKGCLTK